MYPTGYRFDKYNYGKPQFAQARGIMLSYAGFILRYEYQRGREACLILLDSFHSVREFLNIVAEFICGNLEFLYNM